MYQKIFKKYGRDNCKKAYELSYAGKSYTEIGQNHLNGTWIARQVTSMVDAYEEYMKEYSIIEQEIKEKYRLDKHKMEECVRVVSDMVNNMSFNEKKFATLFTGEHRTLQQNFTRVCVAWLEQLAEQKMLGRYDLRNQDSVDLGEAFVKCIAERARYLSHV